MNKNMVAGLKHKTQ